jgi:nitrogen fixation protein FixH
VTRQEQRLTTVLRWEPLLGIAVLICTGLLNVFGSTLLPTTSPQPQSAATPVKAFTKTVKTSDNKFTVTLSISPNRAGPNTFTVSVLNSNGQPDTNLGVSLYTTMLDMDMGTDTVNLQPDNKGHFSATGDLTMSGNWEIRIQIRTPDDTLHETKVQLFTPF